MAGFSEEINKMQLAHSLNRTEFRVFGECRKELVCKIDGNFSDYELKMIQQELNEAMAPVLSKWVAKFIGPVKRSLEPYKRDDE